MLRSKLIISMLLKTDPIRKITLSIWIKILTLRNFHSKVLILRHSKQLEKSHCDAMFEFWMDPLKNHFIWLIWPKKLWNLPSCQKFPPIFPTSVDSTVHKKQRLRNVPLSQFFDKGCIKPFDRILSRSFRMLKIYFVCIIQNITVNDSQ